MGASEAHPSPITRHPPTARLLSDGGASRTFGVLYNAVHTRQHRRFGDKQPPPFYSPGAGKGQVEVWDGSTMVAGGYGPKEVKTSDSVCNYNFQVVGLGV